ncbi:MAG TPA: hypothetical protein VLA98_04350 [Solirubrobacteraceae bacterium]|nr:hypothetical protein [Solirubrobacteraceae bacterium]
MLAWASPPTLLRRALLPRDRIVTGRIVQPLAPDDRRAGAERARRGGARRRLRPDAVFRASAVRWPGGKLALR